MLGVHECRRRGGVLRLFRGLQGAGIAIPSASVWIVPAVEGLALPAGEYVAPNL
jgi:hypothetical protein